MAVEPQRRAAAGRAPVSLPMASQEHLPAARARGARRGLCRPRALPALPARAATSIGGNWDPPLPRERLPAPIHPTPVPPFWSCIPGVSCRGCPGEPRARCGVGTAHPRHRCTVVRTATTLLCGVFAFRAQRRAASPLPLLMGIHAALALPSPWHPAGTACPFPSLCSQGAACAARLPGDGLRWPLAHLSGALEGFWGGSLAPQPLCGMRGEAMGIRGWDGVVATLTLVPTLAADTRQQEGWCRRDRGCRGARPICPSASGCRVLARCRRGWGVFPCQRGDLRTGAGSGASGGGRGCGGEELQPPAPPGCAVVQGDERGAGA